MWTYRNELYHYDVNGIFYGPELYHHGVKGMKWGVRRSIAKHVSNYISGRLNDEPWNYRTELKRRAINYLSGGRHGRIHEITSGSIRSGLNARASGNVMRVGKKMARRAVTGRKNIYSPHLKTSILGGMGVRAKSYYFGGGNKKYAYTVPSTLKRLHPSTSKRASRMVEKAMSSTRSKTMEYIRKNSGLSSRGRMYINMYL